MKKGIFLLFFVFLLFIPNVLSIRLYFDASGSKFVFDSNMEKTISYSVANNIDQPIHVNLSVEGDLAEYVTLDKYYVKNVGPGEGFGLTAYLKLPEKIERPGLHKIFIGATEYRFLQEGIGARGSIRSTIKIRVRYPGQYIETSLSADDAQVGKQASFRVNINNFGTERINMAMASIDIFDPEGNKITTIQTNKKTNLVRDNSYILNAKLDTTGYARGEYSAVANVFYDGNNKTTNKAVFRIGDINIKVVDQTRTAYAELINPFDIVITSEWNNIINDVYAEVNVMRDNLVLSSFKTPNYGISAWETKNITGYLNAMALIPGTYNTNITLFYAGKIGRAHV